MDSTTKQQQIGGRASTEPSSRPDSEHLMRWAAALIARFAVIWPKSWADSLAGMDVDMLRSEWAKGIEGLTGEEIKAGIDHCRSHCNWPPSIAEFRQACHGGANAEQRAYAARSRDDDTRSIRNGTWGDTAAVVAEHVQTIRAAHAPQRAMRCQRDIESGAWTRELEANFQHHANLLGKRVKAIEWPVEMQTTTNSVKNL